jgi:tetratricopeptide (TPR) repeat protein
VTGTEERLATGDAVNVAARLQQAAAPDEVLVGQATLDLVRGAVETEAVDGLELKGKSAPVAAHRLLSVREAPERSHGAAFVGRAAEVASIHAAWQRAGTERRCELLTIVGDAGIGKSRLVAEALAALDAQVVRGRCLPYGDGITYWPVVEVIKQLRRMPSDPAAEASIRSLLGETGGATRAEEIGWAFRKLLEESAPLIVVFDDIQWGEQTFLDLVEGVALLSAGAPLLVICMARPELTTERGEWPVSLRLEPLPDSAVEELVGEVDEDLRNRILAAAGGNPLFLTEMLAMAAETVDVEVPPTLRALLAARLDQLDPGERRVIECGAVEGEVFHRGSVQALDQDEAPVTPRLAALTRKELIRPDRAIIPGDDGFRFRHLLIRDAAYDALPKSARADLHQRFAEWLDRRGADLVELDEIIGYHLEQAARYLGELGRPDAAVAERAQERLVAAGRRALWREDFRAAVGLLRRSLELVPPTGVDVYRELELAEAHANLFELTLAAEVAEAAAERARSAGNERGELVARVVATQHRLPTTPQADAAEGERLARRALPPLETAGDHAGQHYVWSALQDFANFRGQYGDYVDACEQAMRHAELAGQQRASLHWIDLGLYYGPRPADEALRTLDALPAEIRHPRRDVARAALLGMLGRFDEARTLAEDAAERCRQFLGVREDSVTTIALGDIEALAGDYAAAVPRYRKACELLADRAAELSTAAPVLGRCLCLLGELDEAEPLARLGQELGGEGDIMTQVLWRLVLARVAAGRGEHAEAAELAGEAVRLATHTDALTMQGTAWWDLGDVLAAAGRTDEAAGAYDQAIERFTRKMNLALAAQVRLRLEAVGKGAAA